MKIPLGNNFSITVHEEGKIFVIGSAIVTAVSVFIFGVNAISIACGLFTLACVAFFRDPERIIPKNPNALVSPGDGVIVNISEQPMPAELGISSETMMRVSIFLSVFNVHVNRVPMAGKIIATNYRAGKFFNASLDKASVDNERNSIAIENERGDVIACVQIAGLVARRIVSNAEMGSFFATGQRYGIIRFGSRMEVYFPKSYSLNVALGMTVVGGETILATAQQ